MWTFSDSAWTLTISTYTKTTTTQLVHVCIFVSANVRTPVHLSIATIFVQSTVCVNVSVCALACMYEYLSICACLCDMMCMMCGSEAYLPPSYIICILLTACPLGVRFTDAYCVPLAALVFMQSHCYGEVHVGAALADRHHTHIKINDGYKCVYRWVRQHHTILLDNPTLTLLTMWIIWVNIFDKKTTV